MVKTKVLGPVLIDAFASGRAVAATAPKAWSSTAPAAPLRDATGRAAPPPGQAEDPQCRLRQQMPLIDVGSPPTTW